MFISPLCHNSIIFLSRGNGNGYYQSGICLKYKNTYFITAHMRHLSFFISSFFINLIFLAFFHSLSCLLSKFSQILSEMDKIQRFHTFVSAIYVYTWLFLFIRLTYHVWWEDSNRDMTWIRNLILVSSLHVVLFTATSCWSSVSKSSWVRIMFSSMLVLFLFL